MILPTGFSYSEQEDLLYIAMERCGSKFVRLCFSRADKNTIHNFDNDCLLPDLTDNILAVMRNPTHRLISAWELMYLKDRQAPNSWWQEQQLSPPFTPIINASADECIYGFSEFVTQLHELWEIQELDKFVRPQCDWYHRSDIEYIDISNIQCHLGLEEDAHEVERVTSIQPWEYVEDDHIQELMCVMFEEDYIKMDYDPQGRDK